MADELILKSIVSDERITATFSDEKLPRYARIGELFITDGILYVYADLNGDGNGRWFPLTDKKEVYTFEQVVESTIWTIPYDYQTDNLQVIVYDHLNKVHPTPFDINISEENIELTFDEPSRGEAYIAVNKIYEWKGSNLTIGQNTFAVTQDDVEPEKNYIEIDSEFINILRTGETTFKKDVSVEGTLNVLDDVTFNSNQTIDGSVGIGGTLSVAGNISSPNVTNITSRVGSLELLTNSDDFNLDTVQEIVDFVKENRSDFDALSIGWVDVQNKPNTVSGYNIIDVYTKTETNTQILASVPTFTTLEGKPTNIDGYGITDAVKSTGSVTLIGDVTGVATFDNAGILSLETTVGDDTHNHIFENVDGLQVQFDTIGTYQDFEDGFNNLENVDYIEHGTYQDFLDGLNGL